MATKKAVAGEKEPRKETAENEIAGAIRSLARALDRLGTADAATPMGAIEVLSKGINGGLEEIASSLGEIAAAIRETNRSMSKRDDDH
jgi:methyl-accepting chemotaxis protein